MTRPLTSPLIDHTLLKAESTGRDIALLCLEAKQYRFASVCINPRFVALAKSELAGSPIKICTVVGFPLGATTTAAKVAESEEAIQNGADEIDVVLAIGALKAGNKIEVTAELQSLRNATVGKVLKVILETALLTNAEIVQGCKICLEVDADYVKSSTGFASRGVSIEDVTLMRKVIGTKIGIKASGAIRTYSFARQLLDAGATRLGLSASLKIVAEEGLQESC